MGLEQTCSPPCGCSVSKRNGPCKQPRCSFLSQKWTSMFFTVGKFVLRCHNNSQERCVLSSIVFHQFPLRKSGIAEVRLCRNKSESNLYKFFNPDSSWIVPIVQLSIHTWMGGQGKWSIVVHVRHLFHRICPGSRLTSSSTNRTDELFKFVLIRHLLKIQPKSMYCTHSHSLDFNIQSVRGVVPSAPNTLSF
jgi:hypothetical protein